MSGGEVRGWTPDVAAILWRRMLSALGDVNTLENPVLHEQVFQYLLDLNATMTKVRNYSFILKINKRPNHEIITCRYIKIRE